MLAPYTWPCLLILQPAPPREDERVEAGLDVVEAVFGLTLQHPVLVGKAGKAAAAIPHQLLGAGEDQQVNEG